MMRAHYTCKICRPITVAECCMCDVCASGDVNPLTRSKVGRNVAPCSSVVTWELDYLGASVDWYVVVP
jgi:hypothetical protein